ncbi:hypothetical protein MMC11_005596 [Xylographa trunciseda]|nr:hypothetical protein [Xylographa trunciseda]
MDIASPIAGFIGLANLVLTGVSSLIDFFGRIQAAPDYIKAIELELEIMRDLILAARASHEYLQAVKYNVRSLAIAVDICQSEVAKLEELIRRFYPNLELGGRDKLWSQVSVALRQKKFTKYYEGLHRASTLLSTVQPYSEMPLRFQQYAMTHSLRNGLSNLSRVSESTRAAVELTNSSLLDFREDLYSLSFDRTKIVGLISSVDSRLGQIDTDLDTVNNATQQLLESHTGFEERLVRILKPSIEKAVSETINIHLYRQNRMIMKEEENLQSNSTTTNLLEFSQASSLEGSTHLSILVQNSIKTAAGTEMWTMGESNVLSTVQPNHRRLSFGYLAIQSTHGIFYKIGKPQRPEGYLVTTVVLVPASSLYSKGFFSSLVEFSYGLNLPEFELEVVPVLATQKAYPVCKRSPARDPRSMTHLFASMKRCLKDLSYPPETPLIISVRPSANTNQEKAHDWYLMRLLAQGMLSSGIEPFSPAAGLWKSLCPKERIIALKAQEEASAPESPELRPDEPESPVGDNAMMHSAHERDAPRSHQLSASNEALYSAQPNTRKGFSHPTQKPQLRRREKRANLRSSPSPSFEARTCYS